MSDPKTRPLPTWRYLWRLARFRPGLYLLLGFLEIMFFGVTPQATGLIVREFFNTLSGAAEVDVGI